MDFIEIKDDKDDLRYEYAKLVLEDKSIYEGECFKGIIMGHGKLVYKSGQVDIGKFFNGSIHGFGKRFYTDGNVYEGEFAEGMRHGKGKFTRKSKIGNFRLVEKGKWHHDKKEKKFSFKIK